MDDEEIFTFGYDAADGFVFWQFFSIIGVDSPFEGVS